MTRVCIGIHVYAQPRQLHATLATVRQHTQQPYRVVLLPDGPDAETQALLASLGNLPQLATAQALGAPACFNRLAAATDADVLVLLESGAQVGPGWLDHLLAALNADPRNGLAGPSTNRSWNEQGAFPHAGTSPAEIAHTAQLAEQRFGVSAHTLEPLYSLADFCYVVKRAVIDAIGAADEGYGLGPCWEMDYNLRAARAGFRGVWAGAAYVYRAPFTARRRREEALGFEANKRRYQDKFCALRLRGERADYEPHCRGEACEHFAPTGLIELTLPLTSVDTPGVDRPEPKFAALTLRPAPAQPNITDQPSTPLVSCIMPTGNRAAFALQAVRYFLRQAYTNCELIVADDGTDNLAAQLPDEPRIRYLRLPTGLSIGVKRNRACEVARGSIIAQWDDDDWYAPERLAAQVAPLIAGQADITGLKTGLFFDLTAWQFWRCTPELHRRLFFEDVHGGTLVYQRRVWEQLARYPDRSLAEDAFFLQQAIRRGARLQRLANENLFVYLRHTGNAWSFQCGRYLDPQGWLRADEPQLCAEDRSFYTKQPAAYTAVGLSPAAPDSVTAPLVSCIMPTANRRRFVPHAIRYFLQQDYANRELIIVDDGEDGVADLIPADPRIHYRRLEKRQTIGAKRNLACQQARGDIILHWDDDDWMANWRISYQINTLLQECADIAGLNRVLYYDPRARQAWQYFYPTAGRPWVAGNTLCYTKKLWAKSPFPEINVGEDTRFVWSGVARKISILPNSNFYVALLHPGNTAPKDCRGPYWSHWPGDLHQIMGDDLLISPQP